MINQDILVYLFVLAAVVHVVWQVVRLFKNTQPCGSCGICGLKRELDHGKR